MTPATLTGAVPGLVTRGCSVIVEQESADCNPCLVLSVHETGLCTVNRFGGSMSPISPSRVALVLDEAGMDRAARWLAERVGLDASGGALWRPTTGSLGGWVLVAGAKARNCHEFAGLPPHPGRGGMPSGQLTFVPGLAGVTDPSTALALAIQALASLALPGGEG